MHPASLVAFALASHAAVALACSCAMGLYVASPADGAVVPANARVFVGDGWRYELQEEGATLTLHDGDGAVVATQRSVIEVGLGKLFVLTPDVPLTDGASYEVRVNDTRALQFTASAQVLDEAPSLPRVLERDGDVYYGSGGGDCGDSFSVSWTLSAAGALLLVDRDRTTTFDPSTLTGRVASLREINPTGPTLAGLGRSGCGSSWKEAAPGAEVGARFGVLDAAGNFSGWSEIDRNQVPGCGCGAGSASGLAAFGLLAAALRRRRATR